MGTCQSLVLSRICTPVIKDGIATREDKREFDAYIRCTSVYDGDTLTAFVFPCDRGCLSYLDSSINIMHRIRLYGYDSPELKVPKSLPQNERETQKRVAINARTALERLVGYKKGKIGPPLFSHIMGRDKYGRYLATIYVGDTTVCDEMLRLGNGCMSYYGGTKKTKT